MSATLFSRVRWLILCMILGTSVAGLEIVFGQSQNQPPLAPVIVEPQTPDVRLADWSGMRMGTLPMQDPDGDEHICSDWEILQQSDGARIWRAQCVSGAGRRIHVDLGDGQFVGPLAGSTTLHPDTDYVLRVRHRDDSGAANDWSPWAQRNFRTGPEAQIFPLQVRDALPGVAPVLENNAGQIVNLPGGNNPAMVILENAAGETILRFDGQQGVYNAPQRNEYSAARVVVAAGSQPLNLGPTTIRFINEANKPVAIYLPEISIGPGGGRMYWVSINGSTYNGEFGQSQPNFSTIARNNPVPWTVAPDFVIERFAGPFTLPVNIAFLPNPGQQPNSPFFYVSELRDSIKLVTRDGTISTYAQNIVTFPPEGGFPGSGERGTAGLVVEPTTGDLFISTVYQASGGEFFGRLLRASSTNGGRTASSVQTVLDMAGAPLGPAHQIAGLTISPAGYLYIQVGDGFESDSAQDLNDWRGKILRVSRHTGQPLFDNPFYNAADGITPRDYVFAYGLRNPFGPAWQLTERAMYFVENGPGVDRFAKLVRGRNYGYDGTDQSMSVSAIYNWNPSVAPVNLAILQQALYNRSGFPAEYEGRMYATIAGYTYATGPGSDSRKCIRELTVRPDGTFADVFRTIAVYNGSGKSTCVGLAAGPDGLYFSDFYPEFSFNDPYVPGGSIWRLRYRPAVDCNTNGVDDRVEIANGTLNDRNGNRYSDACDITSGTSRDCDLNGVPDESQATMPQTTNFNNGLAAPWRDFGTARKVNGAINLTQGSNGSLGTLTLAPYTNDSRYFRATFDFRMNTNVGTEGIGFSILDADRYAQEALFDQNGPGAGSITVTLVPFVSDAFFPSRVRVTIDGGLVQQFELPYRIDDGQQRRVEWVMTPAGVTLRIRNSDGAWRDLLVSEQIFAQIPQPFRLTFSAARIGSGTLHEIDNVTIHVPSPEDANRDGNIDNCVSNCGDLDFNNDGVFPDFTDIEDFLSAFSGGACSTGNCDTIDFNRDNVFPDTADLQSLLQVLAGGAC